MTTNDIRFDRALYVREVQQLLRTLAFDDARVPLISADGIFGRETADAVAAAQQSLHMTADGRVDYPTWLALTSAADRIRRRHQPPMAVPLYGNDEPAAGAETPCDAALGAQIMCRALARHFANIPAPELTGLWDNATERDIREIQQIGGLPVTGQMDAPTWNAMTEAYAEFCRGAASPH